jgi:hypothetical protein
MKAFLFAVLFVLIAVVAKSQTTVDARIGGNLSGLSEGDWTMKFGVKAGFGVDHAFTDLFALRSGLFFSMKGASDAETSFDYAPSTSIDLNYIEIPLLASFRFPIAGQFGVALNAGPSFGYRVSKDPAGLTEVNKTNIAFDAGLDLVFSARYEIGIEGQYGISELAKASKQHTITYSLLFGYRF